MWALLVAMHQFFLCLIDIISQIISPRPASLKEKYIDSSRDIKSNQIVHQNQRGLVPFKQDDKVLLVGEGDFSFSVSLIKQDMIRPENLIATSYDSKAIAVAKYPKAEAHLIILAAKGVQIMHEVDVEYLPTSWKLAFKDKFHSRKHKQNLDFIMFNFPHSGKSMGSKKRNVSLHQMLIRHYFQSCTDIIDLVNVQDTDSPNHGKIVLTLFESEPYISWKVVKLARERGYWVERSARFVWAMFPEYHHCCTNNFDQTCRPARSRAARMYVFEKPAPRI